MIRAVVIFGGRSAEHEVSILSARSVNNTASREGVAITPVCIAKDGRFIHPDRSGRILSGEEKSDHGDRDFSCEAWSGRTWCDGVCALLKGNGGDEGGRVG